MRDILFDEKIAGSFHFTPGQAYEIGGNGNKSRIHWDMVNIQRKDYGGGEDLVRRQTRSAKDGLFTIPALKKLNPELFAWERSRRGTGHWPVGVRVRHPGYFCSSQIRIAR